MKLFIRIHNAGRYLTQYRALADAELLAPVRGLYERGISSMEEEYQTLLEAEKILAESGFSMEELAAEKSELYDQLGRINQEIRSVKQEIKMCQEIQAHAETMQKDIEEAEQRRALEEGPLKKKASPGGAEIIGCAIGMYLRNANDRNHTGQYTATASPGRSWCRFQSRCPAATPCTC